MHRFTNICSLLEVCHESCKYVMVDVYFNTHTQLGHFLPILVFSAEVLQFFLQLYPYIKTCLGDNKYKNM